MTGDRFVRRYSGGAFELFRGKSPLLSELDIELTERCNNRCIHCLINLPQEDMMAKSREMGTEFVLDVLRQAADLGCLRVRFTGGEPLLRPDFRDLYLATRRMGMQVLLFTNARLITTDLAELFAQVPPGLPIEVSVYGMSSESYDAVVGVRGAFKEFRKGVDLLLHHRVPFIVKQALLPQNIGELDQFEAWATTIPGMSKKPGYVMNLSLRARRDDPEKNERIRSLRMSAEMTVKYLARNPGYVPEMREFCQKFLGPQGDSLFSCGAGLGASVDSYGYAQMCQPLRDPRMVYDLKIGSLLDALTAFFPALRGKRSTNPDYLQRCAICFLKGLCEQCPAKSWIEHGTLDTPVEYLCEVAHAQARYLGLIGEEESAWTITDWRERVAKFVQQGR